MDDIRQLFPDWESLELGCWSDHARFFQYGLGNKDNIEIGLYREPAGSGEYAGTYTLQGLDGDEVLFSHRVEGLYKSFTKSELEEELKKGIPLENCFPFESGQECEIYKIKSPRWDTSERDLVYYVADTFAAPHHRALSEDEIKDVLERVYSGGDFLDECAGDIELSKHVFSCVDWQSPSSYIDADMQFYEDEEWIEICGKTYDEIFSGTQSVCNEEPIPKEELPGFDTSLIPAKSNEQRKVI